MELSGLHEFRQASQSGCLPAASDLSGFAALIVSDELYSISRRCGVHRTDNRIMPAASSAGFAVEASEPNSPLRPKILARNLNFFYGAEHALKSVSVPLFENKVTAFIGPSGCGKSTLLRVFNRIYQLYPGHRAEGEVLLDGENILHPETDINLLRTRIGMVFQKPETFPMSIRENVAFGVKLFERPKRSHVDDRVEEALRAAGLWDEVKDQLSASGRNLSGGQMRRVDLAEPLLCHE